MATILVTICARGGSKGVPGKNIRTLSGKPLIAYTIAHAKEFLKLHKGELSLSTDSEKIKDTAKDYGLHTEYTRDDSLASDTAGKIDAIKALVEFEEKRHNQRFDYILDLDVTSPMRTQKDLQEAYGKLENSPEALNIFSVSPAHRNPYFNMVEEGPSGFVKLVKRSTTIKSRQQAPPVYDMNASFYFYRREFFEKGMEISITDQSLAYVMDHKCFDIDHEDDFKIMELLLENNLLSI